MTLAISTDSSAAYNVPLRRKVFEFPNAARIVPEATLANRTAIASILEELIRLPRGWDGYRAPPVSFENANFALKMMESICGRLTPPPQVVPGSGGDLQVEWHLAGGDVELHVRGPNDVHAWRRLNGQSGVGESLYLKTDFTTVGNWLGEISEQAGAASHAAA